MCLSLIVGLIVNVDYSSEHFYVVWNLHESLVENGTVTLRLMEVISGLSTPTIHSPLKRITSALVAACVPVTECPEYAYTVEHFILTLNLIRVSPSTSPYLFHSLKITTVPF